MFNVGGVIIDVLEKEDVVRHYGSRVSQLLKDVYKGSVCQWCKATEDYDQVVDIIIWHSEHNTDPSSNRTLLAWGLFLNYT